MKFKGTWIFAVLVILVAGFAIYDYRQQEQALENKGSENIAYPGKSLMDVKSFSFRDSNREYRLENSEGRWKVTKPLEDKADRQVISDFFGGFFSQELKPFEGEGTIDWAQYGLDKPAQTFEVEFSDGKKSTLEFGTIRAFDENFYVRKDGEKMYLAEVNWVSYINKTVDDFRDKTFFPNSNEPSSFTLKVKGRKPFTFSIVDGKWILEGDSKFQTDDSAISEFVNKIRHLKGDAIAAETKTPADLRRFNVAPDQAEIAVTFKFSEADVEPWHMYVSAPKGAAPSDQAAVVTSSLPAIYQIQKVKLMNVKPELRFFRNKFYPFSFDQQQAHQVRIQKKGDAHEMRYTKIKGQWEIDVENPHLQLDPAKVDELLVQLRDLRVGEYLGRAQWNSKSVRENKIQVLDFSQKQVFTLEWGGEYASKDQEKMYLAKTSLADEVIAVNKSTLDAIAEKSLLKEEEQK